MKGTGAKRNVCPGSCVSTGAKFPVAPVESAPMDTLIAADDKKATLLALLDLSATFDCVDDEIPLTRLQSKFGLDGAVLAWIRSFLSVKAQCV